jgi:molecular chaperone DnaK (HSP70)
MKDTRYIVGIDLGTTNSVVAYVDTESKPQDAPPIQIFPIPQLVNPGVVEERNILPSFLYIPGEHDLPEGALRLPWAEDLPFAVGELAQKRGAEVPMRLVSSAKSWLCHLGVDRTAPILPWGAPEEVRKMSPLTVSAHYLIHIKEAWNYKMARENPEYALEQQQVFLTVPASFDPAARDLTAQAAEQAGLREVTLLEEPQAAFYSWIESKGEKWRRQVKVNDVILVCDIGGGTSDFSLIAVSEEGGELALKRIAVGEHILLGGDNMDITLAYTLQRRLADEGTKLDSKQLRGLFQSCRVAKENLLKDKGSKSEKVTVLGGGSRVVGGTIRTELTRKDVESILIDGFFPHCKSTDRPQEGRRVGLQEIGLPYAADPAATRHLAKFLGQNRPAGEEKGRGSKSRPTFRHPTGILFNGGVMKANVLRQRLTDLLNEWLEAEGSENVRVLEGTDPDLAVARGAAYYGLARRGKGVRIRGGAARTYYVGIETAMPAVPGMATPLKALCVAPFGMEEGTEADIPGQEFGLVVGEPAEFRFLSSVTRREDKVGTILEEWNTGEIEELSPLNTVLSWEGQEGMVVPVRLHSRVTELGMLELWCATRDNSQRWKLEFNIRTPAEDETPSRKHR